MAERNVLDSEEFDKYMLEKGMIDQMGNPIKLNNLAEKIESMLKEAKWIINNRKKAKEIVLYLQERDNKDGRGEYYARLYIPK